MGIRTDDLVILAVERRTVPKLQDPRPLKKIIQLDEHLWAGFAGLTADSRILLGKARIEAQSHRLTLDQPMGVEAMARHIADVQQQYTQKGGSRPFGLCCLVVGVETEGPLLGKPRLFLTEPSGLHSEWLACSVGKGGKAAREFLEAKIKTQAEADKLPRDQAFRLAVEALMEVVQNGVQGMDIAFLDRSSPLTLQYMTPEDIQKYVDLIDKERAEEAERKKAAAGMK